MKRFFFFLISFLNTVSNWWPFEPKGRSHRYILNVKLILQDPSHYPVIFFFRNCYYTFLFGLSKVSDAVICFSFGY